MVSNQKKIPYFIKIRGATIAKSAKPILLIGGHSTMRDTLFMQNAFIRNVTSMATI